MNQAQVFFDGEGDAWFNRNQQALLEQNHIDWPLKLLHQINPHHNIVSAIEFGCANGWRLARLPGNVSRVVGVDVSAQAIKDGRKRYPSLELWHGFICNFHQVETFDLVIVNFVLHWIDRSQLAQSVAVIDRVLADGGLLILGDFLPDEPVKRRYHHRSDVDLWTWKQNYAAIFESFGIYKRLADVVYDHDNPNAFNSSSKSHSRANCVVLAKQLNNYYSEDN